MELTEQDKLDRIAGAIYRKIMSMGSVGKFKNLVRDITDDHSPDEFKDFVKSALQEAIEADNEYLTELEKIMEEMDL